MQQRRDHIAFGVPSRYQYVPSLQGLDQRVAAHVQLVPEQVHRRSQLLRACTHRDNVTATCKVQST